MPDDLRIAYETFTLLCTKYGVVYTALAMQIDPIGMFVIGNVTERGHELAQLLRQHAEILDRKVDAGQIQVPDVPPDRVN